MKPAIKKTAEQSNEKKRAFIWKVRRSHKCMHYCMKAINMPTKIFQQRSTFLFSPFLTHTHTHSLSASHAHFAILVFRWKTFRWCCAHMKTVNLCAILHCFSSSSSCSSLYNLVVYLPNFIAILGENILRSTIPILVWDNTNNNNNEKRNAIPKELKKKFIVIFILFSFSLPFFLVFL